MTRWTRFGGVLFLATAALTISCGKDKKVKYDTNLLVNPSFEEVGRDGIPRGWSIESFRGPEGVFEVRYGSDDQVAQDGKRSWFFAGDPNTKRFYNLVQEVEVPGETRIRLTGWLQTDDTDIKSADQFAQCNFLLTFYDANHHRFQEMRVSDKRTPPVRGTVLWTQEDVSFRLPDGTHYVKLSCAFGMTGRAWFDNLSLTVPTPTDWQTATSKNFVFHWLKDHPMPDGSQESQQMIFDNVAKRLGVESNVVINYYFYPDTTTIRSMLGLKGYQYVSWDDVEFHSINANDNHEVIHFITDPIGRAPRSIVEGTVYWLHDDVDGVPVAEAMSRVTRANGGEVVPLKSLFDYNLFVSLDPRLSMPSAASFVAFLVERFGVDKLMEFYRATNGMTSYDGVVQATEKVYGIPLAELEEAWSKREKLRASKG